MWWSIGEMGCHQVLPVASTGDDDVHRLAGLQDPAVWAETYVDLDRLAVVDELEDLASPPLPVKVGPSHRDSRVVPGPSVTSLVRADRRVSVVDRK